MNYNARTPDHLRHNPIAALRDLRGRLMGDHPPTDLLELAGAIAELIETLDLLISDAADA